MSRAAWTVIEGDAAFLERIGREWGPLQARHLHLPPEGFSLLALDGERVIGLLGVRWLCLPAPLEATTEAFIDIIEVQPEARRQGIATALIERAAAEARAARAFQLRAWSSEDKVEALSLWRKLGFVLCPAVEYPRGRPVRGFFVGRIG
jgi:GNAT superfamily N-acetyltransferase